MKDESRLEMKQRIRALTAEERAHASEKICAAIERDEAWKSARVVAAFLPIPSEPQIGRLLEKMAVCIPRVRGEKCDLVLLAHGQSHDWRLAAPEIDALPAIDLATVDLILVPGLAFTEDGRRLGRGGGYYDRLLANLPARARRIGVCFDAQIVASLPTEAHDQRVERVITESSLA